MDVTSRWGCPSPSKVYKVALLKSPLKPKISGEDSVCVNQNSYAYTVTPTTGVTYNWKVLGGNIQGGISQGNSVNIVFDFATENPGLVIAYGENEGGCQSPSDTFIVHPAPVKDPSITGPISVCPNNDNIIYEIENLEWKGNYNWSADGARMENNLGNGKVSIDWGSLGLGKVIVKLTTRFGCSDTAQLTVVKSHNLIGQPPIGDTIMCELTQAVS